MALRSNTTSASVAQNRDERLATKGVAARLLQRRIRCSGLLALRRQHCARQAGLFPMAAAADDTTYVVADDQWHFDVIVYGWLPSISGETRFPLDSGDEASIDSAKILDNLKMVFFGGFSTHKGDWGALADFIYLDIGNHKGTTVTIDTRGGPVEGSAHVELDLKAFVSTVAGTYALAHGPQVGMQLLAGARVLDVKGTLALDMTGGRSVAKASTAKPSRSSGTELSGPEASSISGRI